MTRNTRDPEVVQLSLSNWIALVGLIVALVGAAWAFTLSISGEIRALQVKVESLDHRLRHLEK